jgi:GTP cyclohydrolase IA
MPELKHTTEEKRIIKKASNVYGKFLTALGYDWENDPNMQDTPNRVAKMMIDDITRGKYQDEPRITTFDNVDKYSGMVFQGNIEVHSLCSHHMLGFSGKAHVAYIPNGKIIGLSKLNRIVDYYSRRPQVQENLTQQIHDHIDRVCEGNTGVAVMIEASHSCVALRGIKQDSTMKTAKLSGAFKDPDELARKEFYDFIKGLKND